LRRKCFSLRHLPGRKRVVILGAICSDAVDLGLKHHNTSLWLRPKFDWAAIKTRHVMYSSMGPTYYNASYWYPDVRNNWNLIVGGLGRICINTPNPCDNFMTEFDQFVTKVYDSYFPKDVTPKDYDDYIKGHMSYTRPVKLQFMKYHAEFETYDKHFKYYCSNVMSFLKLEGHDQEKKPRWINPRSNQFKAYVGDLVSTMDDIIYSCLEWLHVKHIDNAERNKMLWSVFGLLGVSATDFTSWEASIKQKLMMIVEVKLVMRLFAGTVDDQKLAYILTTWTGIQHCENYNGVVFNTIAQRQSGELTTSGFNFLTDAMATMFAYYDQFYRDEGMDYFVQNMRTLVKAKFEGDDGLHCCVRGKLNDSTYIHLGLLAKMQYYENCSLTSFCGQLFSPATFVNQTDPVKFILKFGWVNARYHNSSDLTMNKLLKAKAYSYAYSYTQCPIIYPIAMFVLSELSAYKLDLKLLKATLDPHQAEKVALTKLPPVNIRIEDRQFMASHFNCSIVDQFNIEDEIILCGLGVWRSMTLDHLIPEKFRVFSDKLMRYQSSDYEEIDCEISLH